MDENPQPVADLSRAPLPTEGTLRRRQNLPLQAVRFLAFNVRIMRMVRKGHHGATPSPRPGGS